MEPGNEGFKKLVRTMNISLPKRRKTLEELMKETKPSVICRDGSVHSITREELEKIAASVPKYKWNTLLLPIIIEITSDFGESAARIRGKVECSLIIELLDIKKTADTFIVLYMHEIKALRKALPTATQYGFFVSSKNR